MTTTTWVEVDLSAIHSNAQAIKAYAQGKSLIAVIKADAYGHGVIPVAQALHEEAAMYARRNRGGSCRIACCWHQKAGASAVQCAARSSRGDC